jgi:hypothetical protein
MSISLSLINLDSFGSLAFCSGIDLTVCLFVRLESRFFARPFQKTGCGPVAVMLQRAPAVDLPKHQPERSLQPADRTAPGPERRLVRRSSGRQAEPPCPHLPFVVRPGQRRRPTKVQPSLCEANMLNDRTGSDRHRPLRWPALCRSAPPLYPSSSRLPPLASSPVCRSGQQLRCHPSPIHWVEHDLYRDSKSVHEIMASLVKAW